MTFSLPEDKQNKVKNTCVELLRMKNPTIRNTARVAGVIMFVLLAFSKGKLHYRELEACKNLALKRNFRNFDSKHTLSTNLLWWSEDLKTY